MTNRLLASITGVIEGPGIKPNLATPVAPLEKIISMVIGTLTIVAVIFFALQIIFAGYAFLTTQGDQKKMEEARKRITEGIMGLFIVVIALGAASLIGRLSGMGSNVLDLQTLFGNLNVK